MAPAATARPTRSLHFLLSATNFAQGLGAFCVVGLLPAIAADLAIPARHAGWLMSVYALVYALSSPLLIAAFGHLDRKVLLVAGVAALASGTALAAVAPDLPVLLLARALMAAGGGLITPVAASMAVVTSTPELRGKALATVFAGLPLAQAVGIPLGIWLAGASSWRWALAAISVVSLATLAAAVWKVPRGVRVQPVSLASLGAALSQRHLLLAVSFIVFFVGSNFTLLTYLAAFLTERFRLDAPQLAWMLAVYGSGAFLGNAVGGAMTDRWGAVRTLVLLCLVTIVMLPLITMQALPLPLVALALLVWAVFGWSVHPAQQARLSHLDPARAPVLLAVHSAALYAGSWAGSSLGGEVLASGGFRWLGPAGALLTAIALGSLVLVHGPARKPA